MNGPISSLLIPFGEVAIASLLMAGWIVVALAFAIKAEAVSWLRSRSVRQWIRSHPAWGG